MARKPKGKAATAPISVTCPTGVVRGQQYEVHATGLEPGVIYDCWATDTHGVQIFGFDESGVAKSYASWDGPYTVEVKSNAGDGIVSDALATCTFEVAP